MQMDTWYDMLVQELGDANGDLKQLLEDAEALLDVEPLDEQPE